MSVDAIKIADAVVASLQAAKLSMAFTAERRFVVPQALEYYDTARVIAVPILLERQMDSRTTDLKTYTVSIGVRKRMGAATDLDADLIANITLAEEIADHLRDTELSGVRATYVGCSIILFDPEAMNESRIATSVVDVQYAIGG